MSRAFVKESSESARPPERMVGEGPNPVTPEGMAQIDGHVARIEAALKTEINVLLRETLERDLRYWTVRKASAELAARARRLTRFSTRCGERVFTRRRLNWLAPIRPAPFMAKTQP